MQIHELNKTTLVETNMLGTGGVVDRIKTGAKTLATQTGAGTALGRAVTPGMNQGATNTAKFIQSNWMDLYRATQMNQATQSWIDGLLKQWKIQASKLKEADERGMNPDAWKEQFVNWSDNMLKTRARNTGAEITMDMVRKDADAQQHLPTLLTAVVNARGTSAFDDAFKQYMQAATTGIYKLTQIENNRAPAAGAQYQAQPAVSGQLPSNITRLFKSMGVANPTQSNIDQLARFLKSEGISSVKDTGSPSLDALFKRMGLS